MNRKEGGGGWARSSSRNWRQKRGSINRGSSKPWEDSKKEDICTEIAKEKRAGVKVKNLVHVGNASF